MWGHRACVLWSAGDLPILLQVPLVHFRCDVIVDGMTILHILFTSSALDGHTLVHKLAPGHGGRGYNEERGRALQMGSWQV